MGTVEVVVARTIEAVEALRPVWASLNVPNIDADIDYFLTVVKELPSAVRPHVIHIRADDRDMLMVARIEDMHLPLKLGYSTLAQVRLRGLILSFDGILGARGRADEALAFAKLRDALACGDADLLIARNLDLAGDRLAAAISVNHWLLRGHGQVPSHRWVIDVSESLEAFLARRTASTRKKLRREERELFKHFEGDVELRCFRDPDDLDEACRDMTAVAAVTYQHKLGAAFSGVALDRALLQLGLKMGWSRVWMLYCAGRPVAFWPGTAYAQVFAVGTPGFDPVYSDYAVGRFSMIRMIGDLSRDSSVKMMDFGQGEAEYKSRFGQALRLERDMMVAAPRPWPVVVLWIHSLFTLANEGARQMAHSFKWIGHLKTAWRRRGTVIATDAEVAP